MKSLKKIFQYILVLVGPAKSFCLLTDQALADHIFGKMTFILSEYLEKIMKVKFSYEESGL